MSECPCEDARRFNHLVRLFRDPLKWYENNKTDKDLVYDECFIEFTLLSRGHYQEILKVLSKEIL